MEELLRMPWGLILAIIGALYALIKGYVYLKARSEFVTKPESSADLKETEDRLCKVIEDVRDRVDNLGTVLKTEYVQRVVLDGWGQRVENLSKMIDGFTVLDQTTRQRADDAFEEARDTSRRIDSFIELMTEKIKPVTDLKNELSEMRKTQMEILRRLPDGK